MAFIVDLPGDKTREKVIADFNKKKPVLLKAIEDAGGSLFVRINVSAISTINLRGEQVIIEGDVLGDGTGKEKEITAEYVNSDEAAPAFCSSVHDYLKTKAENQEIVAFNSDKANERSARKPLKEFESTYATTTSGKTLTIEVFTKEDYMAELHRTRISGLMSSRAQPMPVIGDAGIKKSLGAAVGASK